MNTTLSKEVLKKYLTDIFVETGTLWGDGVKVALKYGFKKIYTIELDPKKVKYNTYKFHKEIQSGIVEIIEGDSFEVFPELLKKINQPATFWLDAHWDEGPVGEHKCPLLFELEYLINHPIKSNKLLIDDRRILGQVNSTWGEKVTENDVLNVIKKINSDYEICFEDGYVPNDIIAAKVIKKDILSQLKGIIHIGASTGQEAQKYNSYQLNILWVEAIPYIYEELVKNISNYNNQIAFNSLLTDVDDKEYEFFISSNNGESSSIFELNQHKEIWPDVKYYAKMNLKSRTLSSLIKKENIELEKYDGIILDTQGSELLVLQGCVDILDKIKYVKIEVADFDSYKGCCKLKEVDEFFENNGFERTDLNKFAECKYGNYYDAVYQKSLYLL